MACSSITVSRAGGAIVVSGGAVTTRRCNFMRNVGAVTVTAGSVTLSNRTLRPTTRGRLYLTVVRSSTSCLRVADGCSPAESRGSTACDGDFHYACAPGVVGMAWSRARRVAGCAAACPAGKFCPSLYGATSVPRGSFCGVGSGSPAVPRRHDHYRRWHDERRRCTCDADSYGVHAEWHVDCFAFWAPTAASRAQRSRRCLCWRHTGVRTPRPSTCVGAQGLLRVGLIAGACREGLQGPYCTLCNRSNFYYDRGRRECLACDTANSASLIGVATGVLLGFCAFSLMVHLVKRRRRLPGHGAPPAEAWWRPR